TQRGTRLLTGEALPARFDAVRAALAAGRLGVDAADAIIRALQPVLTDYPTDDLDSFRCAERTLVCNAIGAPVDETTPAEAPLCADDIRAQAALWAVALDPDGVEPSERTWRSRAFTLLKERNGLVPVTGMLLPEVAAQVQVVLDALTNPRQSLRFLPEADQPDRDGEQPRDPRSRAQRQHDALAIIADLAGRSGELPTLNSALPTRVITVLATDLDRGVGVGFADGLESPLPMSAVRHSICTNGTQAITLLPDGAVAHIGPEERTFTRRQRRALEARDGGCIIPGCPVPAHACEGHHVIRYSHDQRTRIENGVLLCWFHHRTIDTSGWLIRMINGTPWVKAPPGLGPPDWRPATKSRTRKLDTIQRHATLSRRD
ncbi:DUF222 domain-containing protein, partial [Rathayibacter sp. YIM 133350]|uniref:HNH endonuclease signature motif containing protein n=1 Tax=Rathayibacter sp. YIM 133350 TaxID=3131992 RepID=UPI00307DB8D0